MPPLSKCRGTKSRRFKRRNTREENAQIKTGEVPEAWDKPEAKAKRRQKDTEARWTKKNEEKHYGYKNHINADQQHKLIQSYAVTPASVHDSQVLDELLDQTEAMDGHKRALYADSAYRSQDQEQRLADARIDSQVCEKGTRGKPLSEEQNKRTGLNPKCAPESSMSLALRLRWVGIWYAPSAYSGQR